MIRNPAYRKKGFTPHARYHFCASAIDQIAGDSKMFDRSSLLNHGIRGANLTDAQLFATAGYFSTINPVGGSTDSVIRIPNMNLHYNGNEKLIGYFLGKITPEGASVEFMGDGGFSVSYPGWSIRVSTTGKAQFKLSDGTNTYFSASTSATVFDGNLHSLGFAINSVTKLAYMWVDEVLDSNFTSGSLLNSGNAIDTRNANTVNLGTSLPNAAASTEGIIVQDRALHLLRLGANDPFPAVATLTSVFQQLRADPGKPILWNAF